MSALVLAHEPRYGSVPSQAKVALENPRGKGAALLGCTSAEVAFTSGGSGRSIPGQRLHPLIDVDGEDVSPYERQRRREPVVAAAEIDRLH